MKNKTKLYVIAMMVMCGGLLSPKFGLRAENQNSVASISITEMWHFSKGNGVLLFACDTSVYRHVASNEEVVVFLFETDVHGEMFNYARLAYVADSLSAMGKTVFIVSGGDFSSGNCITNLTQGEAPIWVINRISQYIAIVTGNHEWDYGFETLKRNDSILNPPMICCNLFYRDSLLFEPYKIVQAGNKRIALIGVLTYETTSAASPADFKASNDFSILDGDRLAQQVQKCVDKVRSDSLADFVILLAHLGDKGNLRESKGTSKKTTNLLRRISGVDLVLNGHDHEEKDTVLYDKFNNRIPELATGKSLDKIGIIRLFTNGSLSTELLQIDKVKGFSSAVMATIDSIQSCYAYLKTPLGTIDFPLYADDIRIKETNLGDYVADAILWVEKQTDGIASMAIINSGSIRQNIYKGVMNFEKLFDAVPFSNRICIVKMKGSMVENVLNQMIGSWPEESGGFPQVAGITFYVDTIGVNKVKDIMVCMPDGTRAPLDANKEYHVATTDFLAIGGDSVEMNVDVNTDVLPLNTQLYMRDALYLYYKVFGVDKKYEKSGNRINASNRH